MTTDWRSIKCATIQWHSVPGISRRIAWMLLRQCRPATQYDPEGCERWHDLTLGQLADMGERAWRSSGYGFGPTTLEGIKLAIDHAAAGVDITRPADAYKPRPILKSM